jgi:rubrerythrin
MKLAAILDEAIGLEEKIHACYRALSRLSGDGVSAELKELAQEEKSHISVLKTGKNFVFRTPEAFGREVISDVEIRMGLKAAGELEEDLASDRVGFTDGARRLSDLEKRFEKVHFHTSVEINDFSLKKLFEALARADAEHRQRLDRLIASL